MEQYRTAEEREARRDLAALYRNIRRDNPAMARLLRARMRAATDAFIWELCNGNGVQAGAP
jgi:hypothetical protein